MMDVAYIVRGKITTNSDKRTLYVGVSPNKAFYFLRHWQKDAGIEIEIWEDGELIRTITE